MNDMKFIKETFWHLLNREGGIVIPIIQRSYTQGGRGIGADEDVSVQKKGAAFLDYLVLALTKPSPVELDFIYGTTNSKKIEPLDGQQRLTTLFLLHWYIAQKEGCLDATVQGILKLFSYETRVSSRDFCENLSASSIGVNFKTGYEFVKAIENKSWFLLSWKYDPSVCSMLGMLSMIHERLRSANAGLWERMIQDPTTAPITFFYTPLEAFGLTDDLYIKMNARGKELTSFEKFKAEMEERIDDNGWDAVKTPSDFFSNQMDNGWTDLFWGFRDKDDQIDQYVLRIFSAILIGHYAGRDSDNDNTNDFFKSSGCLTSDDLDKDSYDFLCESLNLFHSAGELLKDTVFNVAPFCVGNGKQAMESLGDSLRLFIARDPEKGKITWEQLVLFYGIVIYLKDESNTATGKFADWLRFIRNMLTNETVGGIDSFVSVKKRLDKVSEWSGDIYGHLVKNLFNDPECLTSQDFDKKSYDSLYETLKLFHSAGENLKGAVINTAPFWWGENKQVIESFGNFFTLFMARDSENAKNKMTWQQLALFYGVAVYLRFNFNSPMAKLSDWLRFVRNILTNGTVDDITPFVSAKNRLDEMAKWSGDIYGHLAEASATNGFAREQMKEECQKAKIYQSTPAAKPIIHSIEDCNFCRGQVGFILECLGINDSAPDTVNLRTMNDIALLYLDGSNITNDFRRALLTIDDNRFYTYWQSEAHTSKCPEAYGCPLFCLIEDMADLRTFSKKDQKCYLSQLLKSLLQSSLKDLLDHYQASETTPKWVIKMIKDKTVLDRDNARFIIIGNDKVWTRQAKTSHYPWEIVLTVNP